jgi:hypothetical protein
MNWFAKAKERARFWDKQKIIADEPESKDKSQLIRFAGFPWPMSSVFNKPTEVAEPPKYEQDDGPLTNDQVVQIKEIVKNDLPTGDIIIKESLFEDPEVKNSNAPGLDVSEDRPGDYLTDYEKEKIRAWKAQNPNDTIKHQRALLDSGKIDHLPWEDLKLHPDNHRQGTMLGFGSQFPTEAVKGDTFLRVDRLPSALYKYNGTRWIEIDKKFSDQYAYDTAYIDHLIAKIDSGEYDPELLSDAERDQIEYRLNNI